MGRASWLKREARVGSADLQLASALLELWDFFSKMPAKASLYGCLRERLVAWWEDIELLWAAGHSVCGADESLFIHAADGGRAKALRLLRELLSVLTGNSQMDTGEVRDALLSQSGTVRNTWYICCPVANLCCSTCRM